MNTPETKLQSAQDKADDVIETYNSLVPKKVTIQEPLQYHDFVHLTIIPLPSRRHSKRDRKGLTSKERHLQKLHKIKTVDPSLVQSVHDLWLGYFTTIIDFNVEEDLSKIKSLYPTLYRMELIGAKVTITRAPLTSVVGMSGVIMVETKNSFRIADSSGKLRTILKKEVEMEFVVKDYRFSIFASQLMRKHRDRTTKLPKNFHEKSDINLESLLRLK